MEFSFVVRDHEYIDVMWSISMLGRIEREDLFIFKYENVDADRSVNFLKFRDICMFERKLEIGYIELIKVFAVAMEPVWVSLNSVEGARTDQSRQ